MPVKITTPLSHHNSRFPRWPYIKNNEDYWFFCFAKFHACIKKRTISRLPAVLTMKIPIQWNNGKETTFQMLVVPGLPWPILFGENHLHSTQVLVDHADPCIP